MNSASWITDAVQVKYIGMPLVSIAEVEHSIYHFRLPDRVATCNSGAVHGPCLFLFLTEAKIPDRVTTHDSGAVHGPCLFLFPDRGQNS